MKIKADWQGGLCFVGQGESGHEVLMDASRSAGGEDRGSSPMELLLHGLAGCMGIDVVMILKKMQAEIEDLEIKVQGRRAEEHPRRFLEITVSFQISGKGLDDNKISRAVELSHNKYCSASNSLTAEITTDYSYKNIEQ